MNKRYCNGMVHVIKQGETLYQLSRRYRVPLALILRANPYVDVYNLQVGQEICIPVARPFGGMICTPIPNRNGENPRMMDNRQGQMPNGNEQENMGQMPAQEMGMNPGMEQMMNAGAGQEMNPQAEQGMNARMESGMEPRMEMQGRGMEPEEDRCPCQSEVFEQEEDRRDGGESDSEVYITSGNKSLGDILKEHNVDWEDFIKRNDLSQIAICEDVVLYFPKQR